MENKELYTDVKFLVTFDKVSIDKLKDFDKDILLGIINKQPVITIKSKSFEKGGRTCNLSLTYNDLQNEAFSFIVTWEGPANDDSLIYIQQNVFKLLKEELKDFTDVKSVMLESYTVIYEQHELDNLVKYTDKLNGFEVSDDTTNTSHKVISNPNHKYYGRIYKQVEIRTLYAPIAMINKYTNELIIVTKDKELYKENLKVNEERDNNGN